MFFLHDIVNRLLVFLLLHCDDLVEDYNDHRNEYTRQKVHHRDHKEDEEE